MDEEDKELYEESSKPKKMAKKSSFGALQYYGNAPYIPESITVQRGIRHSLASEFYPPRFDCKSEVEPFKKSLSAVGSYKHLSEYDGRSAAAVNRGVRISEYLNQQHRSE